MESGHADYAPITVQAKTVADVNDIPDNVLLGRALKHLASRGRSRRKDMLWVIVQDYFALGSTYSAQLCRRFGHEPDRIVRRP